MAERAPITCHVLDTMTGKPAANIPVQLVLLEPNGPAGTFTAITDADGRVKTWNAPPGPSLQEVFDFAENYPTRSSVWSIKFDTGSYFGVEHTFFPFVDISFTVKPGEHYHVPLLLGPWSYTTYRGS
jgi:5-hydroxyisourate hydrolase